MVPGVVVQVWTEKPVPTVSGESDCCSAGGIAVIVVVLVIVVGLIVIGWRRADDD